MDPKCFDKFSRKKNPLNNIDVSTIGVEEQCHSRNFFFCYTNHLILMLHLPLTALRSLERGPCQSFLNRAKLSPGSFVPVCASDGTYENKQCDYSTGSCWCVHPMDGVEIKGSKKMPGKGAVVCGRFQNFFTFSSDR